MKLKSHQKKNWGKNNLEPFLDFLLLMFLKENNFMNLLKAIFFFLKPANKIPLHHLGKRKKG